jgi:2-hydroxychromene-2-carboxylate isomerase
LRIKVLLVASLRNNPSRNDTGALGDPDVPLVVLDLASVETYLLAQPLSWLASQAAGAVWCPLISAPAALDEDRDEARRCAERVRLALSWRERHPAPVPRTMRFAALACSRGKAASFFFGASGMAFGSGIDLEQIEPGRSFAAELRRGLDVSAAETRAAREGGSEWDVALGRIARELAGVGISSAPALRWRREIYLGAQEIDSVLAEGESLQPRLGLASTDRG